MSDTRIPDGGSIYGRSVAFPPRVAENGRIAWSEGTQNIRESIRIILLTNPGERLGLSEFGAGLQSLLFEPNTATRHRQLQDRIERALARWEPRINLLAVNVDVDPGDPEAAVVAIEYELVATRSRERLTFNVGMSR
ncbi:MAG TPA: GPW/gp25 family protein [Polyangiaceae bacterium]|nr:GPW/gp25 family protein [Polyangiaceae bacterium]